MAASVAKPPLETSFSASQWKKFVFASDVRFADVGIEMVCARVHGMALGTGTCVLKRWALPPYASVLRLFKSFQGPGSGSYKTTVEEASQLQTAFHLLSRRLIPWQRLLVRCVQMVSNRPRRSHPILPEVEFATGSTVDVDDDQSFRQDFPSNCMYTHTHTDTHTRAELHTYTHPVSNCTYTHTRTRIELHTHACLA